MLDVLGVQEQSCEMECGSSVISKDYLGMIPVKELQATMKYQLWEDHKEYGCGQDQANGNINCRTQVD